MKKSLLSFFAGAAFLSLIAAGQPGASSIDYAPGKRTAEVEQYQGLYVFTDSKPVLEYDYIATVKYNSSMAGRLLGTSTAATQYEDVRDGLLKIVRKECDKKGYKPDAVILHLKSGDADTADLIKFK